MPESGERLVEAGGLRLRVVSEGDAGPPIVVLHGGPGLPDYTGPLAALLAGVGQVHRYDQRGSGRSERIPPYTLDGFVADLDALRVALGHGQWHVVGHSWGATLGLHYALAHPDRTRSLAYVSGTGLSWPSWRDTHRGAQVARWTATEAARHAALCRATGTGRAAAAERFELELRTDTRTPDRYAAAITDLAGHLAAGYDAEVGRALNRELDALDPDVLRDRCATLTEVPVLIVHGRDDPRPAAAGDGLVDALPTVRRELLDAGHLPWLEQPKTLGRLLRDHIASSEIE